MCVCVCVRATKLFACVHFSDSVGFCSRDQGFAMLENRVKEETQPTLQRLSDGLVRSVMITGDNPLTGSSSSSSYSSSNSLCPLVLFSFSFSFL